MVEDLRSAFPGQVGLLSVHRLNLARMVFWNSLRAREIGGRPRNRGGRAHPNGRFLWKFPKLRRVFLRNPGDGPRAGRGLLSFKMPRAGAKARGYRDIQGR